MPPCRTPLEMVHEYE